VGLRAGLDVVTKRKSCPTGPYCFHCAVWKDTYSLRTVLIKHLKRNMLRSTLKMEAIRSSETLLTTCMTTRRHNPEDSNRRNMLVFRCS
jgi:hypothetical protein